MIYSLAGGGAERVVSVLLQELQDSYDITLVLMCNKIDYDTPKDIKIYFLEDSNPYENGIVKLLKLPFLGLKYKNFCQKNSVDISLAFMNRPSYVAIFSKMFGNRARNIISERTTPSMMYRHNNLLSKVSRILIKKLYPKADMVIANAEGNRLDLIDNFAIDKAKVVSIANPFDLEKIKSLSQEGIKGINFERFTFVTVGRLDEGKNHKLMIDAFAKLDYANIQLLILGEGSLRGKLEEQIKSLKLENHVFLLDFDNNPYKYFAKSNAFVFTSNYEGFPNVLVEALACGLPVVSTDCQSGPRKILAPKSEVTFQLKVDIEITPYGILTPVNKERELIDAMSYMIDKWSSKEMALRADSFDKRIIMEKFMSVLEGENR